MSKKIEVLLVDIGNSTIKITEVIDGVLQGIQVKGNHSGNSICIFRYSLGGIHGKKNMILFFLVIFSY